MIPQWVQEFWFGWAALGASLVSLASVVLAALTIRGLVRWIERNADKQSS